MMSEFCRWWLDGLLAPLPRAAADWLDPPRQWRLIELTDRHLSVLERSAAHWTELRRAALDDEPALAQLLATCREHQRRGGIIALRVPAAQALVREVEVTTDRSPQALRDFFKTRIDEYTPFSSNEVRYACLPAAKTGERIRLLVTPKQYLQPAMDRLSQIGVAADTAVVESHESAGAELFPLAGGRRAGGLRAVLAPALAVVLTATAAYLPLASRGETLAALEAEARSLASQVAADQRDDSPAARLTAIVGERGRRPLTVMLVDALSRQIPDHTWLQQLIIAGNEVTLQGETQQAADLIARLEAASGFEDAKFEAALTRDSRARAERFKLTARIAQP